LSTPPRRPHPRHPRPSIRILSGRRRAFRPKNAGDMGVPGVEALEAAAGCRDICRRAPAIPDKTPVGSADPIAAAIVGQIFLTAQQVSPALKLGISCRSVPARRCEGEFGVAPKAADQRDTQQLAEESNTMGISHMARAAAIAAGVGIAAFTFGIGPVSAVPLDPPPSPAPVGPAMAPGTSSPATTNIPRPGVGSEGPHGGQNQTKAPGK
jgi:hypothetical protein